MPALGNHAVSSSEVLLDPCSFLSISNEIDTSAPSFGQALEYVKSSIPSPTLPLLRSHSVNVLNTATPLLTTNSQNNEHNTTQRPQVQLESMTTAHICSVRTTSDPNVFVFHCASPQCRKRTFARWYDFNRHYNGAHATEKTIFWCPMSGCSRSEGEGNHGFPRKDKMMNHVSNIHRHAGRSQDEEIY